jgi:hypothetical protein
MELAGSLVRGGWSQRPLDVVALHRHTSLLARGGGARLLLADRQLLACARRDLHFF